MQGNTEARIRQDLIDSIDNVEEQYKVLTQYLSGATYDSLQIKVHLQAFKGSLNKTSAYLLTLYNLRGQPITIPWDSLLTNIDHAITTVDLSPEPKIKAAIELAFNFSEPKIDQVMSYLRNVKNCL
ncbi:MAG: hypothetical protein NWF04_02870 [Candidatus Bathyarchaeota archaeon]|nr:hypothetical protein [Candidatus Bathyarchaeota archaeon]